MTKKLLAILSHFSTNIFCTKLKYLLNKINIHPIFLNLDSLFTYNKQLWCRNLPENNFIEEILKTSAASTATYLQYLKRIALSKWLLNHKNLLQSKQLIILNSILNVGSFHYENMLIEIEKCTTIEKTDYVLIFCINFHFIKNPYYLVFCLLEILFMKSRLNPNVVVFLENFLDINTEFKCSIKTVKNMCELLDLVTTFYKTYYISMKKLLYAFKKKIFNQYNVEIVHDIKYFLNMIKI